MLKQERVLVIHKRKVLDDSTASLLSKNEDHKRYILGILSTKKKQLI